MRLRRTLAALLVLLSVAATAHVAQAFLQPVSSPERVSEWLGCELGPVFDGVALTFGAPNGVPGIESVTFRCPKGVVTL